MKISVLGSTKVGYMLPKEEAVDFSGKSAGICYLPDTIETLFNEPVENTAKRANGNIKNGHHSVFGHVTYNLCFENIPKILAMILNNEKMYNTSEKSARYTKMSPSPRENVLYLKWIDIFKKEISKKYPDFNPKRVEKLAQENARYMISVFTPTTIMEYSVPFGQLNYIINWAKDFIEDDNKTDIFSIRLKGVFKEFLDAMPDLEVDGLNSSVKGRSFSLLATRQRKEEFGENYSTNYSATFAELAQAQRHRTLLYEMSIPAQASFFVPPIIKGTYLELDWINDITSLKDLFPQGMLVNINERGTIENFVLKCMERLCGAAQLEIMQQTHSTMEKYLEAVRNDPELLNYLLPYSKGARCTFPGWKCESPCIFGGKKAMDRLI